MKKKFSLFLLACMVWSVSWAGMARAETALPLLELKISWGHFSKWQPKTLANFDGYIQTGEGGLVLKKTAAFEWNGASPDRIATISPTLISWQSRVTTGNDGLLVSIAPKSLDQRVVIKIGTFYRTYTVRDLIEAKIDTKVDSAGHRVKIRQAKEIKPTKVKISWGRSVNDKQREQRLVLWSGSVLINNAKANASFNGVESSDRLLCQNGCKQASGVTIESFTNRDTDSLILTLPSYEQAGTVTISLQSNVGSYQKTFKFAELAGINSTQVLDGLTNAVSVKTIK
jgi:hypothetical protein